MLTFKSTHGALLLTLLLLAPTISATEHINTDKPKQVYQADLKNGYYKNPIINADYSDPDVVAVKGNYYMTASSFNAAPGLPILHSTDLVNWSLINYALKEQVPVKHYQSVQHGNGVWAPNIRYHDGLFWIFYPDPDFGIYVVTAKDPAQQWSEPRLILAGKGLIDPTPLWDDDGKSYLLHAWAKSRAGINNILSLREMANDASWVSDKFTHIVDGNTLENYRTLEGPKFYKRGEYYYIFAPAGGVDLGWQSVFRSKNIMGPYQAKVVMEQGNSLTNGPHQGSWVHTDQNEDWFIHFQSKKAYGRIVHLQPMQWRDGWPVIGRDIDGDGIGEPVLKYKKPKHSGKNNQKSLIVNDEFSQPLLSLQWQWNANAKQSWYSLSEDKGHLRLYPQIKVTKDHDSLWHTPSLLLQKLPSETFSVTTKLTLSKQFSDNQAGMVIFGEDYAWLGVSYDKASNAKKLVYVQCKNARKGCNEHIQEQHPLDGDDVELRMMMQPGGFAIFSYRTSDKQRYRIIGEHFSAKKGRWVGAKIGLFNVSNNPKNDAYIDVDYVRFKSLEQQ